MPRVKPVKRPNSNKSLKENTINDTLYPTDVSAVEYFSQNIAWSKAIEQDSVEHDVLEVGAVASEVEPETMSVSPGKIELEPMW